MGEVFCCFKIITVMMSRTLKYSSYYHTFKEIVLEEQFANPIINPKQASPSYGFLSEWLNSENQLIKYFLKIF